MQTLCVYASRAKPNRPSQCRGRARALRQRQGSEVGRRSCATRASPDGLDADKAGTGSLDRVVTEVSFGGQGRVESRGVMMANWSRCCFWCGARSCLDR